MSIEKKNKKRSDIEIRYGMNSGACYRDIVDDIRCITIRQQGKGLVEVYEKILNDPPKENDYACVKWKAKLPSRVKDAQYYLIGLEDCPGFKNGITVLVWGTSSIIFLSKKDGKKSSQIINWLNPTHWHEYEIRWHKNKAELYVDGTLTNTKTDNIPSDVSMFRFFEVYCTSTLKSFTALHGMGDWTKIEDW